VFNTINKLLDGYGLEVDDAVAAPCTPACHPQSTYECPVNPELVMTSNSSAVYNRNSSTEPCCMPAANDHARMTWSFVILVV